MQKETPPLLPTLPMQLMVSMGTWLSSPFALQCANDALPNSKQLPQKDLKQALEKEAKNRAVNLLAGILRYIEAPYERNVPEKPAIWHRGNARLLDYGLDTCDPAKFPSVTLFVPSLINKYYILDLEENRSMLRFLASQNIYPLVLDWGKPGTHEMNFSCEDYISDILLPAIDYIHSTVGKRISLVGYCMGGVLALAAAALKPRHVSNLALLATPWDFHCKAFTPFIVEESWQSMIESLLQSQKTLSADVIQTLFYMTDPWVFENKFRRFADMQEGSRMAKDFIALERWVNDGVPMTANVARDCLIDWAQRNELLKGAWKVAGKTITPSAIKCRSFVAIPQNDHVVPADCAMPLAQALKKPEVLHPSSGHVGMIVGTRAKTELWQPLVDWLNDVREKK